MQAFNPYLPSYEYVPDGEPYVFNNRVYIYGSHDEFNGKDFCMHDYVCWSAPIEDLGDWRYEGVIYRKDQDPKNPNGKMRLCAPDVQQGLDGRYYLYYEFAELTVTSVAVCDEPAGKYEFYGYVQRPDGTPYGSKKGEVNNFDPGVFIDDDGKIYLYTGFAPEGMLKTIMGMRGLKIDGSYCIELEPDMITMKGEPVFLVPGPDKSKGTSFEGHSFFEASSMRKINGTYYYIYSSELSHELCYATSDRPNEGFRYGGTLVSIGDVGLNGRTEAINYTGNTHGSMVEIGGEWYIFYHRQTNKQKCARQACAEKLTLLPDGKFLQAELTSCGLNNGPLKGSGTYEARIACNLYSAQGTFACTKSFEKDKKKIHPYFTQTGSDRENNPDQYIANMTKGSVAGFKYFELDNPESISVCVKASQEGVMAVYTEEQGTPVAEIKVLSAADWKDFSGNMQKISGTKALYFKWNGNGACDFMKFTI